MRMAAHELVVDAARNRLEIACSALGEQQREEERLVQQVTELVDELRVVIRHRGIRDLVRLLHGVGNDRARRLVGVPRALAAQQRGELLQLAERLLEAQPVSVVPAAGDARPGGAKPEAYSILSAYSCLSFSSHFVTASERFWPSSVSRIVCLTLASGVGLACRLFGRAPR